MSIEPLQFDGPAGRLTGWVARGSPAHSPVLFIHPINTRGLIWRDVAAQLLPHRTSVMPDLRAHGNSDPAGEFGLTEWLSDAVAALDSLEITEPVHVVGASLGGSLACCFAARQPGRVISIAALGSSLNFEGVDVEGVVDMFADLGVEGTFRAVFPTLTFGPHASEEIIEQGIALANPNDVATVQRVWRATIRSDATSEARAVRCPALVVSGEFDATCTPALGLVMARELRTEQLVMPDIGHMPMLECPDRVAVLLSRHFAEAEAAR